MLLPHFAHTSSIMTKCCPIEYAITGGCYICCALMILLLPIKVITSFFTAAAIHEICHILALRYHHVPVLQMKFGIGGAIIQTVPLSPRQEFYCSLAGPIGSFLCVLPYRYFPLLALCGIVQGLFNLLPVYPLDGGRILRSFFQWHCLALESVICKTAAWCTIIGSSMVCIYLFCHTSDYFYFLPVLYFLLHIYGKRKIPCNEPRY